MPIDISSKDNERIKYTKSLLKSKNRQKESKYILTKEKKAKWNNQRKIKK